MYIAFENLGFRAGQRADKRKAMAALMREGGEEHEKGVAATGRCSMRRRSGAQANFANMGFMHRRYRGRSGALGIEAHAAEAASSQA